jgi:hypothetical protein
MKEQDQFRYMVKGVQKLLMTIFVFVALSSVILITIVIDPTLSAFKPKDNNAYQLAEVVEEVDEDRIENGIHVRTGLIAADGYMEVVNNCTACHSAKLVTQNRMNAERWAATIDWMQETQNLWDLGKNEEIIINYLVTNYPQLKIGRRASLTNIEWYELKE